MELVIRNAEIEDINTIGYLAYQIWPISYKDILSLDQLQYMLKLIYSPSSLKRQMMDDHHRFFIAELNEEPVGFASFSKLNFDGTYKLHKLYVRTVIQGKGLGKALLNQVEESIIEEGGTHLHLNVNRKNKALAFYEKMGFVIIDEEDIDIGHNFFMNDYVLEKKLES